MTEGFLRRCKNVSKCELYTEEMIFENVLILGKDLNGQVIRILSLLAHVKSYLETKNKKDVPVCETILSKLGKRIFNCE